MATGLDWLCSPRCSPTIPAVFPIVKILACSERGQALFVRNAACRGEFLIFLDFLILPIPFVSTSSPISGWGENLWQIFALQNADCLHYRDQFCSMLFTLSNLYLFGCVYANGFSLDWRKCGGTSPQWPVSFVLTTLPFAIRVIQSVKRYTDSGLVTHLINVCWLLHSCRSFHRLITLTGREIRVRNRQLFVLFPLAASRSAFFVIIPCIFLTALTLGSNRDIFFILWCLFTSCSSIYSATWVCAMPPCIRKTLMQLSRTYSWIGRYWGCIRHTLFSEMS